MTSSTRPNRTSLIIVVIALIILWFAGSWYWYTCHIKGLCAKPPTISTSTGTTTPSTTNPAKMSIAVPGYPSCEAYITSYISYGAPDNDSADIRQLERYLNRYEHERLNVSGIFGKAEAAALVRFEKKHKTQITQLVATHTSADTTHAAVDLINQFVCQMSTKYFKG